MLDYLFQNRRFTTAAALLLLVCIFGGNADVRAQEAATGDHVKVRWLAPQQFGAGPETLGFYFEVDPEWHVYWRNPGDSGAAPRFDFAEANGEVGEIQWPFPVRLPIEHLTNLGYAGNVAYLFEFVPTANSVDLKVNLEWLVCKVDCIPGFGSLSLTRPVADESLWNKSDRNLRDTFAQKIPSTGAIPWQLVRLLSSSQKQAEGKQGEGQGEESAALTLKLHSDSASPPDIFPLDGAFFTAALPAIKQKNGVVTYHIERVPGALVPESTGFVVSDGVRSWQLENVAINKEDDIGGEAKSTAPGAGEISPRAPQQPLWLLVLAAIAGGAILNLMPCVFPVLSIKLFGLVGPGSSTGGRVKEGLVYGAGVVTTFALLGALLLLMRAGGAAVGWGFQLQSAPVVLGLIVLFWLIALAFSGVFEFGHRLVGLAEHSRGGSFATGVLAVFVAAPCTGPFMGVALGAATLLPAYSAMAIFLGLGVGLALPFVLLCAFPALLNRLPPPGRWMETLRQLLAFPIYATVIWLLWVLGRLVGEDGWLIGATLLLLLAFAFWLASHGHRLAKVMAGLIMLTALALSLKGVYQLQHQGLDKSVAGSSVAGAINNAASSAAGGAEARSIAGVWHPYDKAAIEQALAREQAVFIDYTAAWCITCQVNKKLVLDTDDVEALFTEHNVYLVRADWTEQDPAITQALAELGRNSVPVYAWYAPGEKAPVLLPQILQKHMIEGLFAPLG